MDIINIKTVSKPKELITKPSIFRRNNFQLFSIIFFITTLISISFNIYLFFYKLPSKVEIVKKTEEIQIDQVKNVIEKVSKLMVLPEGEEPTFATVMDPAQLQNQPFFAKAKKGDQVLVYSIAKKVILYDPIANKVIDVAPLISKK